MATTLFNSVNSLPVCRAVGLTFQVIGSLGSKVSGGVTAVVRDIILSPKDIVIATINTSPDPAIAITGITIVGNSITITIVNEGSGASTGGPLFSIAFFIIGA